MTEEEMSDEEFIAADLERGRALRETPSGVFCDNCGTEIAIGTGASVAGIVPLCAMCSS